MKTSLSLVLPLILAAWLAPSAPRAEEEARYTKAYKDPVLVDMEKARGEAEAAARTLTDQIRARQAGEEAARPNLKFVLEPDGIQRPASPDDFKSAFHFPPVPQDRTGGCWCFSGMSFFESEVFRQTGRKIRLSQMYIIYYEYVEKARRFVRERGESRVSLGSEINAVPRIMKLYGAIPLQDFPGLVGAERYEHVPLIDELQAYLDMIKTNAVWDEDEVLDGVKIILDKYIGKPPDTVDFEGKTYSPGQFLSDVLEIKPDDYVVVMSTLAAPFHKKAVLDVADNWWRSADYLNLPLDEFYNVILNAVTNGYTVGICGDTSEPGYIGKADIAVVPDFDIPPARIDQNARELRIANGATSDDHCIHLIGHTRLGDHDWFLIKDSSLRPNPGKFWGYIFYRDDYVKLKMLSYIVHKDAMP